MRVLVTGSEGIIGRVLTQTLREEGHALRTLDSRAQPNGEGEHISGDIRDIYTVRRAVQGMEAVAHLAAIPRDLPPGQEDQILTANVQGTWNVLIACVEAGVKRLIYFSSINALGNFGPERPSSYLPIDDAASPQPLSPYQISKHLGEEMCRAFSARHGLITLCLRPVIVVSAEQFYPKCRMGALDAEWMRSGYWAYVDVRDVCDAALRALTVPNVTHDAFLLTAADTMTAIPTTELVAAHYPNTPWPKIAQAAYLADNPYRSLIHCSHAAEVLGWQPQYSWREPAVTPFTP
jgi:UDP-glucose 4-epimerase